MKRLLLLLGCSGALLCGADLAGVHTVYVMPMARGLDQYLANRISSQHVFQVVTDPKLADAVITDMIGEVFQTQLEIISPTPKPPAPAAEPEPADKAAKPTAAKPTDVSAKPADASAKPADAAAKPANASAKPGDASAKPADASAKPADASAKPAETAAKTAQIPAVMAAKSSEIEKAAKPAKSGVENPGSVISMFTDTENRVAPPVSTFGRGKGTIFLVDAKSRQVVWSTFNPSKGARNLDLDRTASDIVNRLKKDLKPKKEQ